MVPTADHGSAGAAFADEQEAIAWIEKRQGRLIPELEEMCRRVRLAATRGSTDTAVSRAASGRR